MGEKLAQKREIVACLDPGESGLLQRIANMSPYGYALQGNLDSTHLSDIRRKINPNVYGLWGSGLVYWLPGLQDGDTAMLGERGDQVAQMPKEIQKLATRVNLVTVKDIKIVGTMMPQEMSILNYLLLNFGQTVGINDIKKHIWGEFEMQWIGDKNVYVAISGIRKGLAKHGITELELNSDRLGGYYVAKIG